MKKIFLNLGKQPITNSFLPSISKKNLKKEFFYNLSISFDEKLKLISLANFVKPKMMFNDNYAHRASASKTMQIHYRKLSANLKKKLKKIKCLEIGSNDGVFIKNFKQKNVVAVEPCKNLAKYTNLLGYKTYPEFWTKKLSEKIKKKYGTMNLIFSSNTISHIENLDEIFLGVENILDDKGIFVFEDPYILSVIKNNSYDQFYDEHAHLFSLTSVNNIVKKFNLKIINVERINTHGGSIRFYISKNNNNFKVSKKVPDLLKLEKKNRIDRFDTYKLFGERVKKSKKKLLEIIRSITSRKQKIIGYGATYKSATIYNYCEINSNLFDYIVDNTKNKQGKYTPGSHIPIRSPETGFKDKNDIKYAFLGAWNFKKEIFKKEINFLKNGGKFITHVPRPRIINLKNARKEII